MLLARNTYRFYKAADETVSDVLGLEVFRAGINSSGKGLVFSGVRKGHLAL